MTELLWFLALALLFGVIKILNLSSIAVAPDLFFKDKSSAFMKTVLAACPIFLEPYIPPLLWGKSGHIQTIVYGKMGRIQYPDLKGERHHQVMPDGATATFDVYHPLAQHPSAGDYTMLVCPGIANSSESCYIRTLVDLVRRSGYRVAVLNHLGALRDVPLTSPRIFDFGCTDEFGVMVRQMRAMYPRSRFLALGFSLGANLVTKYLGEDPANQTHFIAGMSLCQGYDATRAQDYLMNCMLQRIYIFAMTLNLRKILLRHRDMLFSSAAEEKYGRLDTETILTCTSLQSLDQTYNSKRAGFKQVADYYQWCSSSNYIHNVKIPMMFLNAEDDPIVPSFLHHIPRQHAESHENSIFVKTFHGGHLGYFEGGYFTPRLETWIDRAVLQFADAMVKFEEKQS